LLVFDFLAAVKLLIFVFLIILIKNILNYLNDYEKKQ